MIAPDGGRAGTPVARAAERLLRSLVGVSAATVNTDSRGRLAGIVVVPAPGMGPRRLARNVASALMAQFGVTVDPSAIIIGAPSSETSNRTGGDALAGATDGSGTSRQHHGNWDATLRNGHGPAGDAASGRPDGARVVIASPTPIAVPQPRIEHVELQAVETGLRCAVVLAVGAERFSSIAESGGTDAGEVALGARVAVDALRTARLPRQPMQLDDATLVDLAGQPHVVTALSFWTGSDFARRSGTEPVTSTVVEAAARSVVRIVAAHLDEHHA